MVFPLSPHKTLLSPCLFHSPVRWTEVPLLVHFTDENSKLLSTGTQEVTRDSRRDYGRRN